MSTSFATLRLGKSSVSAIQAIDALSKGIQNPQTVISVVCTQVPTEFDVDTYVFIWLGSDNNKGITTQWKQGFKAIGQVTGIVRGAKFNDESTTTVKIGYVFSESVNRLDILRDAPSEYYWCSSMPIVGLDDHSNQTIRMMVSESERAEINAFFQALAKVRPEFRVDISSVYPAFDTHFESALPIETVEMKEQSPYLRAANTINSHLTSTGFSLDISSDDLVALNNEFNAKFSPKALRNLEDDKLLTTLFYSTEVTNDSMCYWLEFNPQVRKYFGSIAGGSAFKFGLYQRKEDGVWVTGNPTKPDELSVDKALTIGKEIRDVLLKGAEIIEAFPRLSSLNDYEELDEELVRGIGKYAAFAWVHKYYHMVFPSKFAAWHSSEWQKHFLMAYGILPSKKYYGRSGQLALIARYAQIDIPVFSAATFDLFGEIRQFYRVGALDGTDNHFSEWTESSTVSIGWPQVESLETFLQGTELNRKAIADKLMEVYYPTDSRTAYRKAGELSTFYSIRKESILVAMQGTTLLALGDQIGPYHFKQNSNLPHQRSVSWHYCFSQNEKLPIPNEAIDSSCAQVNNDSNLLFLYDKYYYHLSEKTTLDEETKSAEFSPRLNPLHALNQIIYGAPGTGKTYSSIEFAMAIIENRQNNQTPQTIEQRRELMTEYSKRVSEGRVVFTTFHQSYGYEEFVQGIRPNVGAGAINFKKVDGVFKSIADTARHNPAKNYVLIIDEINRGNISKIFGELITLIEDDKRLGELNQLSVVLPMGEPFSVPNNLYIIGTMNSADKSISLIDTALRRRFSFVEMAPDATLIENETLRTVLLSLNTYIKKELRSTDLLVGHAYFLGKTIDDLQQIMNNSIIPLLYEYFYDDEAKVRKALECLSGTDCVIDSDYSGRIRIKKSEKSRD